jgi:hypothetical protein
MLPSSITEPYWADIFANYPNIQSVNSDPAPWLLYYDRKLNMITIANCPDNLDTIPDYIRNDATRLRITNSITDLTTLHTDIPKLSRIYYFGTTIPPTEPDKNLFGDAAAGNTWLHRFYAPNVTYLPHKAFYGCSNLTSVSFGKPLVCEGNEVFTGAGCERWQPKYTNLSIVTISDITDLSSISDWEKSYITTLIITGTNPDITNITNINNALPHIANIELPNYNSAIPNSLFSNCSWLKSFSAPLATEIGSEAFQGCIPLVNVDLPEATTIGHHAFQSCFSLVSVNLPKATTIGNYAFQGCFSLVSVNLPEATTIGNWAFSYCSSLTDIILEKEITNWGTDVFVYVNTSNITLRLLDATEYANATGTSWQGYTFYEILGP